MWRTRNEKSVCRWKRESFRFFVYFIVFEFKFKRKRNVTCNATNRRNVYFSRFPQILEFSKISKTQKRVHECIYHPTPCIHFIRSRVGAYVRVHTRIRVPVQFTKQWEIANERSEVGLQFFFQTLSITQRRFHHENRPGLCAAQFSQQSWDGVV